MSVKYAPTDRLWFALGFDGNLYVLGDCTDFEAADEVAMDLGINAVWIVDPEQAQQWHGTFSTTLAEGT